MRIEQEQNALEELDSPALNGAVAKAIIENTPKAEQVPPWFKETVRIVTDAWFDPKSFEKNPKLYETLGVRQFKKYVPTTGDLVIRLYRKRFSLPNWVDRNTDSLKKFERITRVVEGIHTVAFGVMSALIAQQVISGNITSAAFTAGLNTLINVYPIMLQRYNRIRVYRAIHKMEERQTSHSSITKATG